MRPVVLREERLVRLHVIVEEEQDLPRGIGRAAIAGAREPAVGLLEHAHWKLRVQRAERVGRSIGRAIHHHHRFERRIAALAAERPNELDHQIATLERRHDHRDARTRAHRYSSRRATAPPPASSTPRHHSADHTTSQSR